MEGGLFNTNDESYIEKGILIRCFGDEVDEVSRNYLTKSLAKIPGVIPPYCLPDRQHVYFMYNVRFDPKAAGANCAPRKFRIAVEKALYKEGMLVGQWQSMPVPAQDLFQSKLGYGGTGYPWQINEAKGVKYNYDPNQFPVAQMLCDTYTIVHGVHAPNGRELMDGIVASFKKVFSNLDQAIAHADDAIYPGADGALYGAG